MLAVLSWGKSYRDTSSHSKLRARSTWNLECGGLTPAVSKPSHTSAACCVSVCVLRHTCQVTGTCPAVSGSDLGFENLRCSELWGFQNHGRKTVGLYCSCDWQMGNCLRVSWPGRRQACPEPWGLGSAAGVEGSLLALSRHFP